MVKSKAELLTKAKNRRKAHQAENKELKLRKKWYNTSDVKQHFVRKSKLPKPSHIRKQLTPGQIVIILSGRFRGRRVVYLKRLDSGLLLVTGPYKYNGVPLKRVNQAYVLPTSTSVKLGNNVADKIKEQVKKISLKNHQRKKKELLLKEKLLKMKLIQLLKKVLMKYQC